MNLVYKFLVKNGVFSIQEKVFELQLLTHPEQPTLKAISDTLDYFNIENIVAKVPEEAFNELPQNLLTLVEGHKKLVLLNKKGKNVILIDEKGKKEKLQMNEFLKVWDRAIIAVEPIQNKNTLKNPLYIIGFATLIIIALLPLTLENYLFLAISLLGVFFSTLLVKEKLGYSISLAQSFCNITTATSCTEVINSTGAKIFKRIDLANASFIAFTVLAILAISNQSIFKILALASLPVLIYSVFYQAIVIKKWCMICLSILACFLTLAILSFPSINSAINELSLKSIFLFALLSTLVSLLFFYVKDFIIDFNKNKDEAYSGIKFKRDPEIVNLLASSSEVLEDVSLFNDEIIVGNLKSQNTIITLTNPYCGHCKRAIENYIKTIVTFRDVKIVFRFSVSLENKESALTRQIVRLVELFLERGQEEFLKGYTEWFEQKNEDKWYATYGKPKFTERTLNLLEKHNIWSEINELNYTPATILNGIYYPDKLQYKDLPLVAESILSIKKEMRDPEVTLA